MSNAIKTRVFRLAAVEGKAPYEEFRSLSAARAFVAKLKWQPRVKQLKEEGLYQPYVVNVYGQMGRLDHLEVFLTKEATLASGAKQYRCTECGGDGKWRKWVKDHLGHAYRVLAASQYGTACFDCHGRGFIVRRDDNTIYQERPEWAEVPIMEESAPQEVVLYQADPEEDLGNGITAADIADLPF